MPSFSVPVYEEVSGYALIEAPTIKEARKTAEEVLNTDGIDGFTEFNVEHRATYVLPDVEVV